jgi:hypothetical protein
MGTLDDLIASAPARVRLTDAWHKKIVEARNVELTWVEIAEAIAADTGTVPLGPTTLRGQHEQWLRRQG